MLGGDHCAVWVCDQDRKYPEKQNILPHVEILRFYSSRNLKKKGFVVDWLDIQRFSEYEGLFKSTL